jgi:RNA polymerase sigma factor (sigma-70 family)
MIRHAVRSSSTKQSSKTNQKISFTCIGHRNKHDEEPKRFPITQKYMASCVAAEAAGKKVIHPAKSMFKEALFESISNMVYMLCGKYTSTCDKNIDDLAQDCFLRIAKRISLFNPKLGSFTTWSWHVCRSQLNREYRRQLMSNSRFDSDIVVGDNTSVVAPASTLSLDITNVVRELISKYPTKKKIIFTMFGGNPDEGELMLPSHISIADVAKKTNMEYMTVYSFYYNKVRPLFQRRFN